MNKSSDKRDGCCKSSMLQEVESKGKKLLKLREGYEKDEDCGN